jgi:hypothetical protein
MADVPPPVRRPASDLGLADLMPSTRIEYVVSFAEPRRGIARRSIGASMSKTFARGVGNWRLYRSSLGFSKDDEIDLHFGERDKSIPYAVVMDEITTIVERGLKAAQQQGRAYVVFIHGRRRRDAARRRRDRWSGVLCVQRPRRR